MTSNGATPDKERAMKDGTTKGGCCGSKARMFLGFIFVGLVAAVVALSILYVQEKDDEKIAEFVNSFVNGRLSGSMTVNGQSGTFSGSFKGNVQEKENKDDESMTCLTQDCVITASNVIQSLDLKVDPCDNFFDYACGGWVAKNVIPDDKSSWNTFNQLYDDMQVAMKDVLEQNYTSEERANPKFATAKAKDLYASCIDLDTLENLGDQPLRDIVTKVFDMGWVALQTGFDQNKFDLDASLLQLRKIQNKPLLTFWSGSDAKNSSINTIAIDQPSTGLPGRDYYFETKYESARTAYKTLFKEVALALNPSLDKTQLETDVDAMFKLDTDIANATVELSDRRDANALYNPTTLEDMQKLYPNVPLQQLVLTSFKEVAGLTVQPSERVINRAPAYFVALNDIMASVDKRTLVMFLQWSFIKNRLPNLNKRFRDLAFNYIQALYGIQSEQARWLTCSSFVNSELGMATGKLYVERKFDEESKDAALQMIAGIRKSFKDLLQTNDWMDAETRTAAEEKANKIKEYIGYPEYVLNNMTHLNLKYERMNFTRDDFMGNKLNTLELVAWHELEDLRKPVDKTLWDTTPAVVNAFYSSTKNAITFPAGILQPPFYHKGQPKAMNYGGIGAVIGHEITHGFDNRGRQKDGDGNLKDWWKPNIVQNFKNAAQCIIDQYSGYVMPETGENLIGSRVQGENIADNGGIKQSFKAYREWVLKQGKEEQRLPGLGYTPNQLFFVNYAQIWCGANRPRAVSNQIATGVHSPNRYRVIGTLSNTPEFADAFKCKAGSKMNPRSKCTVW